MNPESNAGSLLLIKALEDVNGKVRVIHAAWLHCAHWQQMGGRCAMTARQLLIARTLLIEAIEDWAMAVGRLLGLSRESGLERLSESLEGSLRRAATYLRTMAPIVSPDPATAALVDHQAHRD